MTEPLGREQAADSTVAMGAYNMLATSGRPMLPQQVLHRMAVEHQFLVEPDRVVRALRSLVRLGYAKLTPFGFQSRGPDFCPVVTRNRGGAGWKDWRIMTPRGLVPLARAV